MGNNPNYKAGMDDMLRRLRATHEAFANDPTLSKKQRAEQARLAGAVASLQAARAERDAK